MSNKSLEAKMIFMEGALVGGFFTEEEWGVVIEKQADRMFEIFGTTNWDEARILYENQIRLLCQSKKSIDNR